MSKEIYTTQSAVTRYSVMESRDHLKNGASLKSHKSRKNLFFSVKNTGIKSIIILIAILAISVTTFAQVTWTLNNGTLTIGGSGAMPSSWGSLEGSSPWYAYYNSITAIVIENGVVSICNYAFSNCSILTTVTIANGTNPLSFGLYVFENCPQLQTVNLGRNISGTPFKSRTSITTVNIIGNNVDMIGNEAFYGCSNLISINLPNTINSIGSSAFCGCTNLTSIALPNSINKIASGTFSYSGLLSIEIPNNINNIDNYAFSNCSILTTVTIANGTNPLSFGLYVFDYCSQLQTVNFGRNISGTPFKSRTSITTVNITGNNVDQIGNEAFYGCSSLRSINLPNTINSIGNSAFYSCTDLTSIVLPNSINKIVSNTFSYSGLLSIEIPDNINNIDNYAFSNCSILTTVTIANGTNPLSFGLYVFDYCSQLQTVNLGRNISGTSFKNKTSITTVNIIGNNVDKIGSEAFYGCTGLTTINSQNPNPPVVENNCFYGVNKTLCIVNVPEGSRCPYKKAEVWKDFEHIIDGTTYSCDDPYLIVADSYNFIFDGGERTMQVNSNVQWNVSGNTSWLTISPISGNGDGSFILTAAMNYSTTPRNTTITVSGGGITRLITISQDGKPNDISEQENKKVQIFPNPANNEIFIKSDLQIKKIEIYSITGALLMCENERNEKISVSALPKSIYFLKIHTNQGIMINKFVKE